MGISTPGWKQGGHNSSIATPSWRGGGRSTSLGIAAPAWVGGNVSPSGSNFGFKGNVNYGTNTLLNLPTHVPQQGFTLDSGQNFYNQQPEPAAPTRQVFVVTGVPALEGIDFNSREEAQAAIDAHKSKKKGGKKKEKKYTKWVNPDPLQNAADAKETPTKSAPTRSASSPLALSLIHI